MGSSIKRGDVHIYTGAFLGLLHKPHGSNHGTSTQQPRLIRSFHNYLSIPAEQTLELQFTTPSLPSASLVPVITFIVFLGTAQSLYGQKPIP